MNAFDALAPTYDASFTGSPIARHLRARVHARLVHRAGPGQPVLELGCGTGEDALFLARYLRARVDATDASEAMLAAARAKLAGEADVRIERLDLNRLPETGFGEQAYVLAFANFGVLNCVQDIAQLAAWLAQRIAAGGYVAFAVMARYCISEFIWHALHGEWRVAARRVRGGARFEQGGSALTVWYPTVSQMTAAFQPWFERRHVEPLGLLLPPSDAYGVVEKRPRLLRALTRLDERLGRASALANAADHYWIEFQRRP